MKRTPEGFLITEDELRAFDKLKKYRHNVRSVIKKLQQNSDMWKEIAQKFMALHQLALLRNKEEKDE